MSEPVSPPDATATTTGPSSRYTRPHAGLPDDLGDIGDHIVGAPKDDVRRLRTRAAWARAWTALAITAGVVVAVALWKVSLGSGRHRTTAVATPAASDPASNAEVSAAASRAALPVDTISPIAAVSPPATIDSAPATQVPLIQPFDPTAPSMSSTGATTPGAPINLGLTSATSSAVPDHTSGDAGTSAPLTVSVRMQRADGFGGGDGMSTDYSAAFAARRSPLISSGMGQGGTGATASPESNTPSAVSSSDNGGSFVPGTRAKARILVSLPSAADGEPIEAVLEDSVVNRSGVVLPAGTRAIGRGAAFDDGTAEPRLMIRFTTFILPDSTVKTLSGVAFAVEDDRIGLPVTLNHQVARKAGRIATAAGVAGAMAMATNSLPQGQTGSVFNQEPPGSEALRQAYDQTFSTMDQELGLSQPPVAALLKLNAGRVFWMVFGMPTVGGGPS